MEVSLNTPDFLKGAYLEAYLSIGNDLISDPDIQAAILSDSLMKSNPDDGSDLDVIAITNRDYWQRKQLTIQDIFTEVFLYSEAELLRSFDDGDYQDMHMMAYGFLMFDKTSCTSAIKDKAKKMYEKGPGLPDQERSTYLRYLVWDSYRNVSDIIDKDSIGAAALMNRSIGYAIEISFALNGRWPCKPKRLLESIQTLNSDLSSLLSEFYSDDCERSKESFEIYKRIISIVIAPHDPDKHFLWNSREHHGSYKLF